MTAEINQNLAEATAAVTLAQGLDGKIDSATATYISTASSAYDTIAKESGLAAASQAVTDGTIAIAGLPLTDEGSGDVAILTAAGLNAAAQGLAQGVIANRQGDIDIAAVQLQSAQTKADNALTVNQALQTLSNVRQQANANQLATTDNNLTLAAALAQQTALQQELVRIAQKQADDSASVRSSYYADPIHYIRSENSLMLADSAFANAQRWVFYAQRALEYKWEEKFASTESSGQGIRTFDSGTIFKLCNATELNDLLTQLVNWNNVRMSQDSRVLHTSFISALNDILAPNPNVANATPTNRVDTGFRVDLKTGELVSQLELFHRLLTRGMDASGNLNIDFDTTHLDNLQADFFVGPNYTSSPIAPGEWRDKIIYLKFNIVATDGTPIPQNVAGSISYGGQTFFRTRIPPCPNRSVNLPAGSADGLTPTEVPGEFVTAPFQLFYSKNYNNLFLSRDTQNQSVTVAYTGATAKSPTGGEILGNTYQNNSFNQRSVAATRWRLTLFAPPTGWDVTKFKDIEIIVNHASSDRLDPTCP